MSDQITTARAQSYANAVLFLAQQRASRLRDSVYVETGLRGKAHFFDQLGTVTAVKKTTRHANTPLIETPHTRRRVTPVTYQLADLIDNDDKLKMLWDPTSRYSQEHMMAMGRAYDTEIITALGGTAYTGEEGGTSTPFSSAMQVAVNDHTYDAGSGDVSLTVGKLIHARKLLGANEADDYDMSGQPELTIACKQAQIANLLTATEIASADYNVVKTLVDGKVDTFMGFRFKRTELLGVDGASDVLCYAWHRDGMALGIWEDYKVRIGERADKSYATQVYCEINFGATRLEEERVVEIACDPA